MIVESRRWYSQPSRGYSRSSARRSASVSLVTASVSHDTGVRLNECMRIFAGRSANTLCGTALGNVELNTTSSMLQTIIPLLDLCGTFAFALSGAMAGIRRELDIFGVLVLSFAASSFGGISRDLVIGAVPPAALEDWRYLAVSIVAGLIAFFWSELIEKLRNPVRMMDAVGLAFFAVSGTEKALAFELSPVMAALLGMLTGIGGGVTRDVLLAEVPAVLRSDLYAVAALAGAAVVVGASLLHLPIVIAAVVGGLVCFGLRMMAIRRGWRLPTAHKAEKPPDPDNN